MDLYPHAPGEEKPIGRDLFYFLCKDLDLPFNAINDPYTRNAAFCSGIPFISLQSYNANYAKIATYSKKLNAVFALRSNAIMIAIIALLRIHYAIFEATPIEDWDCTLQYIVNPIVFVLALFPSTHSSV